MLSDYAADIRYSLRWLLRSPGFTAVAVLSLAIGIGFNTAVFSIIDALLLRPLAVASPERLVDLYTQDASGDRYSTSSYPDYVDFRARNSVFSGMVGYSPAIAAVKAGDRSRMALGEVVTGNYFQVLGVSAALGRTLLPQDDTSGATRAVVIADRLWRREYAADPTVLGRHLQIHGQSYAIVGVLPATFTGMVPMLQPEVWIPVAWVEEVEPAGIQHVVPSPGKTRLERRGQRWLFVKGRLKDGESAQRAQANVDLIMSQLATAYPKTNDKLPVSVVAHVRIHPEADRMLAVVAAGLMTALGLVLLVACANITNMLLARASGRRKEIGVRIAIGASRGRLIRQLLTESLVLAALGGTAGILLAAWGLHAFESMPVPIPIPLALGLRLDARVLLFTVVIAVGAGVAAGLAPALRATKIDLVSDLKEDLAGAKTGRQRWTMRNGLVAAQTAVTFTLLVAASLLTRSILHAQHVDLGFRTSGVVALGTELSLIGYTDTQATELFKRAADRMAAIPGVTAVSRAVRQPLAINYNRSTVFFPDGRQRDDRGTAIAATWVDDRYFATLAVPLLRGRNFNSGDTPSSTRVAIVTDGFVKRYWPKSDGLGQRFRTPTATGPVYEVVGVVGDYKVETVGERANPYIHYALSQRDFTGNVFIASTATDAGALLSAMRREILSLEPNAVFLDNQTMDAQVNAALLPARLAAQTSSLVGIIATLLAAVGVYGVIAYAVGRRTREFGIRMALGATPDAVLRMVMRQGLSVAAVGVLVGLVLSFVVARALAAGLYGVSAADPIAWSTAAGLLLGAAALANYVPARRAARVDPAVALRTQ
jgi:putative ABC transport system permease protein